MPQSFILDPAEYMLNWMEENWQIPTSKMPDHFFSSGPADNMVVSGKKAFGTHIQQVAFLDC